MSSAETPSRAWAVGDTHVEAAAGFAGRFDDVTVMTYRELLGRGDVEHLDSVGLVLGSDHGAVLTSLQVLNTSVEGRHPRVWLRGGSVAQVEQLSARLAALPQPWSVRPAEDPVERELVREGSEHADVRSPRSSYVAMPTDLVSNAGPEPAARRSGPATTVQRVAAALRRVGLTRRHVLLLAVAAAVVAVSIVLAGVVGGWSAALTVVGVLVLVALGAVLAGVVLLLRLVAGLRRTVTDQASRAAVPPVTGLADDELVRRLDALRELLLATAHQQARATAERTVTPDR